MMEKYCRPTYQTWLVDPVAKLLPLSPTFITFLGLLSGLASAVCIFLSAPFSALALLALSGYLDTLDGTVARLQDEKSQLGTFYDIVSDRIVEVSLILAFFLVDPTRAFLCLLMLISILLCITTFLTVGIFAPNESRKGFFYSEGLIERAETFLFFGAMIWFPSCFSYLAITFSLLVLLTALLRTIGFANIASNK